MKLKKIYHSLPNNIKYSMQYVYKLIPQKVLKGNKYINEYNKTKEMICEADKKSRDELDELQFNLLKKTLKNAYENVHYYKELFDKYNINVSDIKNYEQYKDIPFLTKDIIRRNAKKMINVECNKSDLKAITTGGTTGVPMTLYMNKLEWARENAFIDNLFEKIGYKKGMKTAIIRGNFVRVDKDKNIYWQKKIHFNEEIFSTFHLTDSTVEYYIEEFKKFRPKCIKAYPSAISILSKYITLNRLNNEFDFIKYIILASENVFNSQREELKKAFIKAKVFSFYGHTEHGCLAGECEASSYYHIEDLYGYVEILDSKDNLVTKDGEIGEIVCTSFLNQDFPFIRYRTGDMAMISTEKCKCGRESRLIKKIEGRKQEFFIDKQKNKISFIYQDVPLNIIKDKIRAYQYIQDSVGLVTLAIESNKNISYEELNKIKEEFYKYYNDFTLEIIFVKNIKRTSRGKFRYLIQNVNLGE